MSSKSHVYLKEKCQKTGGQFPCFVISSFHWQIVRRAYRVCCSCAPVRAGYRPRLLHTHMYVTHVFCTFDLCVLCERSIFKPQAQVIKAGWPRPHWQLLLPAIKKKVICIVMSLLIDAKLESRRKKGLSSLMWSYRPTTNDFFSFFCKQPTQKTRKQRRRNTPYNSHGLMYWSHTIDTQRNI